MTEQKMPPTGDPSPSDDPWATTGERETGEGQAGSDTARDWMSQLQSMIDNVATQAAPVMREVGAKAAELAALAGEKAGPIAHKAAEVTEAAGSKLAERGRVVAADLRRDAEARRHPTDETAGSMETTTPPTGEAGQPQVGTRPDSADSPGV